MKCNSKKNIIRKPIVFWIIITILNLIPSIAISTKNLDSKVGINYSLKKLEESAFEIGNLFIQLAKKKKRHWIEMFPIGKKWISSEDRLESIYINLEFSREVYKNQPNFKRVQELTEQWSKHRLELSQSFIYNRFDPIINTLLLEKNGPICRTDGKKCFNLYAKLFGIYLIASQVIEVPRNGNSFEENQDYVEYLGEIVSSAPGALSWMGNLLDYNISNDGSRLQSVIYEFTKETQFYENNQSIYPANPHILYSGKSWTKYTLHITIFKLLARYIHSDIKSEFRSNLSARRLLGLAKILLNQPNRITEGDISILEIYEVLEKCEQLLRENAQFRHLDEVKAFKGFMRASYAEVTNDRLERYILKLFGGPTNYFTSMTMLTLTFYMIIGLLMMYLYLKTKNINLAINTTIDVILCKSEQSSFTKHYFFKIFGFILAMAIPVYFSLLTAFLLRME